jgi:hypothetical protein
MVSETSRPLRFSRSINAADYVSVYRMYRPPGSNFRLDYDYDYYDRQLVWTLANRKFDDYEE